MARRETARPIVLNKDAGGNWANSGIFRSLRPFNGDSGAPLPRPATLAGLDRQFLPIGGRFCA